MRELIIEKEKEILRAEMKQFRSDLNLTDKQEMDFNIGIRLNFLPFYLQIPLLLTYLSTEREIDTRRIIEDSLHLGKQVALPRCVPGTREMEFYRIVDLNHLVQGPYGVWEPEPNPRYLVTEFGQSICLVPAYCYDRDGYRLGYGGGYYDAFLAGYKGLSIGLAYHNCLQQRVPRGDFDRPVKIVVTETEVIQI